ncbi:MAG: HEPN domain-containing protein [Deltaproteobacteria bacterium]|nr:HEPN domain-containing protein [Deltaproteobacteria bacterium]
MTAEARAANIAAEVAKARAALHAADELFAIELFDDAMSRLYYAAFHLASAALLAVDVEATTHRGLLSLVSLHLVKPARVPPDTARGLTELFSLRNQADYDRHFVMDADGAADYRRRAANVLAALDGVVTACGHEGLAATGR